LGLEYRYAGVTGATFEIREAVRQRAEGPAAVAVGGEREASGERRRDRVSGRHALFIGWPGRLPDPSSR
jgi:hypothetical protein